MLRQSMRFALALLALVALSGCAVERVAGPQVDLFSIQREGAGRYIPRHDGDPRDPPAGDPIVGSIPAGADSLWAGDDNR